jgi:hypothetical protein
MLVMGWLHFVVCVRACFESLVGSKCDEAGKIDGGLEKEEKSGGT